MAQHPVRHWLQDQPRRRQNFGDYLTRLFLDELFALPSWPADAYHLVGSVITESQMRRDLAAVGADPEQGSVAFWGCGLRDDRPLSAWARRRARFFGIRGPLSRDVLGLPPETVLGDPGLLLPLLHPAPPRPPRGERITLCVTHILEPRSAAEIRRQTGVDRVVSAGIPGHPAALRRFIDLLARADFVLSGALHGAIAACAYGVPFAYFDSGYVDVPFKWADFAASVGLPCRFARSLAEGRALWRAQLAPALRPPPLLPLLGAAPFAPRQALLLAALRHDGHLAAGTAMRLQQVLLQAGVDRPEDVAEAQAAWLARLAPPAPPRPALRVAGASCARVTLHQYRPPETPGGYRHLDIGLSGVALAGDNWPAVRCKLSLTGETARLEFREGGEQPRAFQHWPGDQEDRFGRFLRLDAAGLRALLADPQRPPRDAAMLRAVLALLPEAAAQAARQARQPPDPWRAAAASLAAA